MTFNVKPMLRFKTDLETAFTKGYRKFKTTQID